MSVEVFLVQFKDLKTEEEKTEEFISPDIKTCERDFEDLYPWREIKIIWKKK